MSQLLIPHIFSFDVEFVFEIKWGVSKHPAVVQSSYKRNARGFSPPWRIHVVYRYIYLGEGCDRLFRFSGDYPVHYGDPAHLAARDRSRQSGGTHRTPSSFRRGVNGGDLHRAIYL